MQTIITKHFIILMHFFRCQAHKHWDLIEQNFIIPDKSNINIRMYLYNQTNQSIHYNYYLQIIFDILQKVKYIAKLSKFYYKHIL